MQHDTDLEPDLDCAHLAVGFEPFECEHGDLHDTWFCEDCGAEFVPAGEAVVWREAALELRDALVTLAQDHARLRVAGVIGLVFTIGMLVGRP